MPTSLGFDFRKFKKSHVNNFSRKMSNICRTREGSRNLGEGSKIGSRHMNNGSIFSAPHLPRVKVA